MARYKIGELSFIGHKHKVEGHEQDNALVKEGVEIEIADDVVPGTHWAPLDKAAEVAHKAMTEVLSKTKAAAEAALARGQHLATALEKMANAA
jgi:hypothetical protein